MGMGDCFYPSYQPPSPVAPASIVRFGCDGTLVPDIKEDAVLVDFNGGDRRAMSIQIGDIHGLAVRPVGGTNVGGVGGFRGVADVEP